jgi:hypothetical protein
MKRGEPRKTKTNHSAGLRISGLRADFGPARRHWQGRSRRQGQNAEVEVPDHPRADQGELLAQGEVGLRQEVLADADGAQGVGLDGFPAGHAHAAAFRRASPPAVAWPWLRRRVRRRDADLGDPGEDEVENHESQEIPEPPVAMRVFVDLRLRPAQLARVVDDVLDAQKEKKRRGLDQDHPEVSQARQGIDPHLRHQDAAEDLGAAHAVGLGGFKLRVGHGIHRAIDDVRDKGPEDDGEGHDRQQETIGLVPERRGFRQRHLGLGTDAEFQSPARARHRRRRPPGFLRIRCPGPAR